MENTLTAIEVTGTIDEYRHLKLDKRLPIPGPMRVRVIVLYPVTEEIDEKAWLRAASNNPAFDYLREPQEDIYSPTDGATFSDEVVVESKT